MSKREVKKENAVDQALCFPNGDEFEARLNELMNALDAESGDPILISFIDCDQFMHVNTDFGHEIGDQVLIRTGEHIKNALPDCATIYRIGGDEFGVLFHGDIEKEEAFLLLEQIRATYHVTLPDGEAMSISIGLAAAFEDASRPQELLRKADSAMFRAKFAGRNKVALAREEKMVPKTSHYTSDQLKRLTKLSKREGIGEAILLREALDMLLKKYDI